MLFHARNSSAAGGPGGAVYCIHAPIGRAAGSLSRRWPGQRWTCATGTQRPSDSGKTSPRSGPSSPARLSPRYFAYSMAFVSRMRFTLIWPGYSSSSSIFLAISRASSTMRSSGMASGLTMMRTSRPAWMA